MAKKISIKIVSNNGHDSLLLSPQEALASVQVETQEKGKWCYMDGVFRTYGSITQQDIKKANEIVLVNALLGG